MASTRSIAVVGATGYVGGRLIDRLAADGHHVVAISRRGVHPSVPGVEARAADVGDPEAAAGALRGVDTAFYLVHAMAGGAGFAERDRELAQSFAAAASRAGVGRIIYLSGLGAGDLSEHLASRHEVGEVLASSGITTVELRAAVILGAGSISFEMLRYLTERLPAMVCPRWVETRIQPIAERDLLDYLVEAIDRGEGVYEIGTPDVTTYRQMMEAYARVRGLRRRVIVEVPVLTPALSAHWVDLVTPVDRAVSHSLIGSLTNEVVVRPDERQRTDTAFSVRPVTVEAALRQALDEQAARMPDLLLGLEDGLAEGVYAMRARAPMDAQDVVGAREDLVRCGGDLRWYGMPWAWRLRLAVGRVFGERLTLGRPPAVEVGADVDWWTVARRAPETLVLSTDRWFCGEAWLGYRVDAGPEPAVEQVGALRTKGLLGFVYWRLLWPVHLVVFDVMARRQVERARRLAASRPPA